MKPDQLASWFSELNEPQTSNEIVVTQEWEGSRLQLGKLYGGDPALVLEHNTENPQRYGSKLQNIAYLPAEHFSHKNYSSTIALLRCRNSDPLMQQYFFRVVSGLISDFEVEPNFEEFDEAVRGTLNLFHALTTPSKASLQGLWAEVFLISLSTDANYLVSCWHDSPTDKFDFASSPNRIEVKSTVGQIRTHRFAAEQLGVAVSGETVVASLCLQRDESGTSLNELLDEMTPHLSSKNRRKVERLVAESLGSNWQEASATAFSRVEAHRTLRYYRASSLPSVRIDEGVDNVKFDLNLSTQSPVSLASLPNCPLFQAIQNTLSDEYRRPEQ